MKKVFNIIITLAKTLEAAEIVSVMIFVIVAIIKGE